MANIISELTNAVIKNIVKDPEIQEMAILYRKIVENMKIEKYKINTENFLKYLLSHNHKFSYSGNFKGYKNTIFWYTTPLELKKIRDMKSETAIARNIKNNNIDINNALYDAEVMKKFLSFVFEYAMSKHMDVVQNSLKISLNNLTSKNAMKLAITNSFNKNRIKRVGFLHITPIYKVGGRQYTKSKGNYFRAQELKDYVIITPQQEVGFLPEKEIGKREPSALIMMKIPKEGLLRRESIKIIEVIHYIIANYDRLTKQFGEDNIYSIVRNEIERLIPHDNKVYQYPAK